MNVIVVLGTVALLLLLPLIVAALRQRTLFTMAIRNISRRRAEAILVVAGALLGTAIITSSLVVGDVIEASFADTARTEYGPVDITVTASRQADIGKVMAQAQATDIQAIDGLLATTTSTGTLEAPGHDAAIPQVRIVEFDLSAAREFGSNPQITGLTETGGLAPGEVLLNSRTAGELEVAAGESVILHAYGSRVDLLVSDVLDEVGLAGYGGAIVSPGTIEDLFASTTLVGAAPRDQLLVSLDGGVLDTREISDAAVADLGAAFASLPGVEIEASKAAVLDNAKSQGAGLSNLFSTLGAFSVLAGILLLINLFVMLAEERKTELGTLRAVGYTRRRLTRLFAVEGAVYAIAASALGAVAGIGIGWLIALVAGSIFGSTEQGSGTPFVIKPLSLAIGATTGLVISLVTIWVTSIRIARINIIRAIRDLPEPKVVKIRKRTLALAALGVVLGAGISTAGYADESAISLMLGIPIAAFSASPLLRKLLPERCARQLAAGTVLAWGLGVDPLFPEIMGDAEIIVFVLRGVVLTAGAVSLAVSLDRVWTFTIELLSRGGRGLAPRLGLAYPLARRFRTSMLLGMFSLVIFTVTILTSFSASFGNATGQTVDKIAANYDIVLDSNPANPIDVGALAARDDVVAVAGLSRDVANFEAPHLEAPRSGPITGFDADLLAQGTPGLFTRDASYGSDAEVYQAVLDDPSLAIVPENFLVAGMDVAAFATGDKFTVIEPGSGNPHQLTIAALGETDWLDNGALVSRELTTTLFGAENVVTRSYVAVTDDADASVVATALNSDFLAQGADARTFTEIGTEGQGQLLGFLAIMQGFLGFGLLVGIAGLGVVMVRSVRERRKEIGMLRAMGSQKGLVRTAMLSEAGLIAVQGTLIGAVLGLITTKQLLMGNESFGDEPIAFIVPWLGLSLILALPLVASLAATLGPASRAAKIRPAIALRAAD
ncbi:MAG: putative transport system permease protein [Acidobacteriota bacterium]|jgi:putative ABC transport system permease protein|nr:putative transport system permease protein [Acidobacteriota bacterium]